MAEKRDISSYDPKSPDNPINQEKREKPKPVTPQEIGFLEYDAKSPNNPKNRLQNRSPRVEAEAEQ